MPAQNLSDKQCCLEERPTGSSGISKRLKIDTTWQSCAKLNTPSVINSIVSLYNFSLYDGAACDNNCWGSATFSAFSSDDPSTLLTPLDEL